MADDKRNPSRVSKQKNTNVNGKTDAKTNTASQSKITSKPKKSIWKRSKWFLIPMLFVVALVTGLIIGYSYIGGEDALEVFQMETWKHLVDLVFADE